MGQMLNGLVAPVFVGGLSTLLEFTCREFFRKTLYPGRSVAACQRCTALGNSIGHADGIIDRVFPKRRIWSAGQPSNMKDEVFGVESRGLQYSCSIHRLSRVVN